MARIRLALKTGVLYAAASAVLFGASTPFAKLLVGEVNPVLLASLLYLGSGAGLTLWLLAARTIPGSSNREAPIRRGDWTWLAAAIACGGVAGPVLLMLGLSL